MYSFRYVQSFVPMDGSGYLIVVVIAGLLLAVVYGTVTKWHERVRDSPESEHIVDRIGKNEQEAKSGIHNTITQQNTCIHFVCRYAPSHCLCCGVILRLYLCICVLGVCLSVFIAVGFI